MAASMRVEKEEDDWADILYSAVKHGQIELVRECLHLLRDIHQSIKSIKRDDE